jgi:hypothetical protein
LPLILLAKARRQAHLHHMLKDLSSQENRHGPGDEKEK